jgi:signal transduction histidine kinase
VSGISPGRSGTPPVRPRLTITAVLLLGFGVTAGLWLLAWYGLTSRISHVESEAAAINDRYIRAQDLLATVRAQVLLGSVIVRDALLEPSLATAGGYRDRFEATYRTTDRALRQYVPVMGTTEEQDGIARLRTEVDAFHRDMAAVLATDVSGWADRSSRLREQIMPRRDGALRVSEQTQTLNRRAFVAQSRATAGVYREAQRHAWQQLGLAFIASLCVTVWAGVYARRLEGRVNAQRERDHQQTADLQRLSAKLVTAQEDERRMIARELHDEVGQALAAIRVELATAQTGADAVTVAGRIREVQRIAEGALGAVRDLSHLLHPAVLDDLGLAAAIDAMARTFERRHGIVVDVSLDNALPRLPPGLEITIYRIAQEALTNVADHASARRCRLELAMAGGSLWLLVEDDGVGFEADAEIGRGAIGLVAIRERALQYGGAFRLDTAPGRGTRLHVSLPMPPRLPGGAPSLESPTEANLHANPAHLPR